MERADAAVADAAEEKRENGSAEQGAALAACLTARPACS